MKSCNVSATGLAGHKTEGEHRKYTHHEMDNLRAAIKNPRHSAEFNFRPPDIIKHS